MSNYILNPIDNSKSRCILNPSATSKTWLNDKNQVHRDDGPAMEGPDGYKAWYQFGSKHRENGPAVITTNGCNYWYQFGKLHREDGPAITYPSGYKEWFLLGKSIKCSSQEEFIKLIKLKAFW